MNPPGRWDFFLSHGQAAAGDQCKMLCFLLRAAGKTVWYDNEMMDRSEPAMEEGVHAAANFLLFLSGDHDQVDLGELVIDLAMELEGEIHRVGPKFAGGLPGSDRISSQTAGPTCKFWANPVNFRFRRQRLGAAAHRVPAAACRTTQPLPGHARPAGAAGRGGVPRPWHVRGPGAGGLRQWSGPARGSSAPIAFHTVSRVSYGAFFVCARKALNGPESWFPARAVDDIADASDAELLEAGLKKPEVKRLRRTLSRSVMNVSIA